MEQRQQQGWDDRGYRKQDSFLTYFHIIHYLDDVIATSATTYSAWKRTLKKRSHNVNIYLAMLSSKMER
jgi:hypothetical protein